MAQKNQPEGVHAVLGRDPAGSVCCECKGLGYHRVNGIDRETCVACRGLSADRPSPKGSGQSHGKKEGTE